MIVMQTVTPAVVGIALAGRHGAGRDGRSVAVVGFVLTCAGAVALARFEGGPEGHGGRG